MLLLTEAWSMQPHRWLEKKFMIKNNLKHIFLCQPGWLVIFGFVIQWKHIICTFSLSKFNTACSAKKIKGKILKWFCLSFHLVSVCTPSEMTFEYADSFSVTLLHTSLSVSIFPPHCSYFKSNFDWILLYADFRI